MRNLSLGRLHLVNAYEVKAGIGVIAFKTVWSMPERLECEVLQKVRYINTLTFTFTCFSILPIDYALALRKLCFLNMQREHFIPVVQALYVVNGFAAFAEQCQKYCIAIAHSHRPVCCKCVWAAFVSSVSLWSVVYISVSSFCLSVTLYCVRLIIGIPSGKESEFCRQLITNNNIKYVQTD